MGILEETDSVYSIEKTFEVKNNTNEDLKIKELYPSCPCLTILSFPRQIAPHSKGEVRMKITLDKIERRTIKLLLALEEKKNRVLEITIQARTPDGATIVPNIIDFGIVAMSQEYTRQFYLNVYTSTDDNIKVSKIETSHPFIRIEKTTKGEITYFPFSEKTSSVKSSGYQLKFKPSAMSDDVPNVGTVLFHLSNGSKTKMTITWVNEQQ
jgi:hypothetical protein